MKTFKLNSIKPNPKNPRIIKDDAFWKLVDSIKRFPHFLEKRGIIHADGVILGGNMRYRAIQEALKDADFRARIGVKTQTEIPAAWVQDASEWSEADRQAFIIADNAPLGEWAWDALANSWNVELLDAFDIDVPELGELPGDGGGGQEEQAKICDVLIEIQCTSDGYAAIKETIDGLAGHEGIAINIS